jgi:hypothetical protein
VSDQPLPKPSLPLLPGDKIGLPELIDLYRHLTGRELTPEEVEKACLKLEEGEVGGYEGGRRAGKVVASRLGRV